MVSVRVQAAFLCMVLLLQHPIYAGDLPEKAEPGDPAVQLSTWIASPVAGALAAGRWHRNVVWGATLGIGADGWSAFVQMDFGFYGDASLNADNYNEILNVGFGAALLYLNRRVRSTFSLGPSFLLTDSFTNPAGSLGLYVDLRPAGILFPMRKTFLELIPLSLSVTAPVLQGVPLIIIQYRTVIALWVSF